MIAPNQLWLLKRRDVDDEGQCESGTPYDEAVAFVVRAASERRARELACTKKGDEGTIWLAPTLVSCVPLEQAGEEGVILRNYQGA